MTQTGKKPKRVHGWIGHVCRMNDDRILQQILYSELTHGKRSTGEQIEQYKDVILFGV